MGKRRNLAILAAIFIAFTAFSGCGTTGLDNGDGYGNNRNWAGSYLRIHLNPEQRPLLGEYSSRNSSAIQQHLDWAQQASIDFLAIPWRGVESWGHTTLVDYLLPEPAFDIFDWCILYETPTILAGDPDAGTINLTMTARDSLLSHLLRFHDNFFSRSNYLHIDEKPVIILRQSRKIAGQARIALNAIRIAYGDSTGGEEFYLIGDEAIWAAVGAPDTDRMAAMDAVTGIDLGVLSAHDGYPQGTGFLEDLSTLWQEYALAAAGLPVPIPLIPMVWPGFNDRVSSIFTHPVIPREISGGVTQTGSLYVNMWEIANAQAGDPAIVLLNSFNDWKRDTQIEIVAENNNPNGTVFPNSATGGMRYFPYLNLFVEITATRKGDVLLGAIYEIWYDDQPPGDGG